MWGGRRDGEGVKERCGPTDCKRLAFFLLPPFYYELLLFAVQWRLLHSGICFVKLGVSAFP